MPPNADADDVRRSTRRAASPRASSARSIRDPSILAAMIDDVLEEELGGPGRRDRRRAAGSWLALPIALAAGLLSFLSPCVLPLVPGLPRLRRRRRLARTPGGRRPACCSGVLLFIAGFSVVFVLTLRAVRHRRACCYVVLRRHPAHRRRAAHHHGRWSSSARSRSCSARIKPQWQPRTGLTRRAAARHRVRTRLDAVHRPDPRRREHPRARVGGDPLAAPCSRPLLLPRPRHPVPARRARLRLGRPGRSPGSSATSAPSTSSAARC